MLSDELEKWAAIIGGTLGVILGVIIILALMGNATCMSIVGSIVSFLGTAAFWVILITVAIIVIVCFFPGVIIFLIFAAVVMAALFIWGLFKSIFG